MDGPPKLRGLTPGALFIGLLGLTAAACTSTPGATRLSEAGEVAPAPAPEIVAADASAAELDVTPLDENGVRGGRIAFTVDGDPEEVLAMLLDFDNASGKRSWAPEMSRISQAEDRVVARWAFEGKVGIHPTIELAFEVAREESGIVVTYFVTKPAFGLAAFFGDYRVTPLEAGRSLLVERVYIDSGIPIANASEADIASGLRDDVERIRAWMRERQSR